MKHAAGGYSLLLHRSKVYRYYTGRCYIGRSVLTVQLICTVYRYYTGRCYIGRSVLTVQHSYTLRLMTDGTAVIRPNAAIHHEQHNTDKSAGDRRRPSDSQEIPYILRNLSAHCRLHKISQFAFIQNRTNRAHKIRPRSLDPLLCYLPFYSQLIQVVICALAFPRTVDTR
jgi:hypothetical protein